MKWTLFKYMLKIIKPKRRKRISRRPWTASETNTLLRLRNEGKNWNEVSKLLNRTASACSNRYGKVKRKGE